MLDGLPFPPPGDFPSPEIEPLSLMYPTLAGRLSLVPPRNPMESWALCQLCDLGQDHLASQSVSLFAKWANISDLL